jgi:predicted alpha/beta superfamily hydrolase
MKEKETQTGLAQPAVIRKVNTLFRKKRRQDRLRIIGEVKYHKQFYSSFLDNKRDIIVWLPRGYQLDRAKRYPVLYMHDGQNIMDPKTSFAGMDWRVDETLTKLIKHNKLREIIVVGIYNTPDRLEEYSDTEKGQNYITFLIKELKPYIDKNYRTLKDSENNAVMGSSMGGIISFLIAWNHPDVFSKAACLSSSFYYQDDKAIEMVKKYNGLKKKIKFYIDHGEDGLVRGQKMFCALTARGYLIGSDIDYFYAPGAEHNEKAWADRLERPLMFFFKK